MKTSALISVMVVLVPCCLDSLAGDVPTTKSSTLRQVAARYGALDRVIAIAPLVGLDLDMELVIDKQEVYPWGVTQLVGVPGVFLLGIERDTGSISDFLVHSGMPPANLYERPFLTREQALTKAQEFLNALGVTEDFTSPRTDPAPVQTKGSAWTSLWSFSTLHKEREIECGGITVRVRAVSGSIVQYGNTIHKPPESLTAKITKQQAVESALRYATERNRPFSEAHIKRVALLYRGQADRTHPVKMYEPSKLLPDMVLQWIVIFKEDEEDDLGWPVAVDALTGKVLDAN